MAATFTTLDVTAVRLTCDLCGTTGELSRETGDVLDATGEFASQHLAPRVLAVRVACALGDFGWCDA